MISFGKSAFGLMGWLVVSFAAAAAGSRFLPGAWYATLTKPAWNPPAAVFAPVWTVLYASMGVAAWLVWRRAGFVGARAALAAFGVQLVLNALWSYLFFGLHRPGVALADIGALWIVILVVAVLFCLKHSKVCARSVKCSLNLLPGFFGYGSAEYFTDTTRFTARSSTSGDL